MMMEHDHQHHDHRHIKMNLKIEELSSVKKKLNVKIDPSEFKSEFDSLFDSRNKFTNWHNALSFLAKNSH